MGRKEKDFDSQLRRFRQSRGVSIQAMAHRTGYSASYLSAMELGRAKLTRAVEEAYQRELGAHADVSAHAAPESSISENLSSSSDHGREWVGKRPISSLISIALLLAMLIAALALVGWNSLQLWTASIGEQRTREERQREEAQITILIHQATDAEMAWYKDPTGDHRPVLLLHFVPSERGGDRLPRIERTIKRLNDENRRFADAAQKALTVVKISMDPDGQGASVDTVEYWYQPLLQLIDGEEQRIPAPAGHPQQTSGPQLYRLQKLDGRWYIQSNPVP
jgi:transcriptional regulator with XRE-family HTH domain